MMMSKKIFLAFFVIVLSVPFWLRLLVFGPTPDKILATENRRVSEFPDWGVFSKNDLKGTFDSIDRYVADRLLGKDSIVYALNASFFHHGIYTSADYSKGVWGANGFLFLGDNYDKVISRHFNANYKSDCEVVKTSAERQLEIKKACSDIGARYVLFVAPDKHSIYSDFFPEWLKDNIKDIEFSRTNDYIAYISRMGVDIVYPVMELRRMANKEIYYKNDTHWNLLGAEIGFNTLVNFLNGIEAGEAEAIEREGRYQLAVSTSKHYGDLLTIMGIPVKDEYGSRDYSFSKPNLFVEWNEGGKGDVPRKVHFSKALSNGAVWHWTGTSVNQFAKNKMRVLVICDSFATAMSPFFNLNFKEVHYVSRTYDYRQLIGFVKEINPNIVVYETVERGFPVLP